MRGNSFPTGISPPAARRSGLASIPEWSMYWPMLLWQQYLFSGDETLLREMAPRLDAFSGLD